MRGLITLLTFTLCSVSIGQNIHFIKTYGNNGYDVGKDIKEALDTGYIATGSSSSFTSGNADAFLLKVDSIGNFQWSYNYGGTGSDWGEKVILTSDSGYAVGGFTNSFGAGGFDFYLTKTDINGVPDWENTYGGSDWDKAHGLVQLADSGYVLVGETYSYGAGETDILIVRTDKFGDTLWTRVYGGPQIDYANDVLLDGDSIVVVGGTESFGAGMSDGIILKYHIDGTLGWVKYAGMERNDFFTSIASNGLGEYFLGGSRMYWFDQTNELDDFWIYNMTADGITVLADTSMTAGAHEVEVAHDIGVDDNDNIFYGGETKSFGYANLDNKKDAWLGRLNNDYYQAAPYVNNFGEAGDDILYGLDMCWDYGIISIGILGFNSVGGGNLFIARIDRQNFGGDFDVTTDLSNEVITLSYEAVENTENISMYPTMVQSVLNLSGFPTKNTFSIFSTNGQLIARYKDVQSQINLNALNNGLYIIVVETEKGVYTQKLVKN